MKHKIAWLCAMATAVFVADAAAAQGHHYVRGYTRRDGTYVAPHYQTNPDSSRLNNWSTRGNVNPYTGKVGTVDPYRTSPPSGSGSYTAPPPPSGYTPPNN